ncbi:hypothetical protein ABEB36_001005 [Hypothenemus hampei]|uniref:WD repeat-containing protein 75 second beta-propeller domain-containing protein n=1 Tax=Hypothenemus hampei TaxID=57062 RepID=A0ABD1FGG9_HYPHA
MDISVSFVAGASIVKLKPVFSSNGENIFVSFNKSVHQYNTKTSKLVYQYQGWDSEIIGLNFILTDNVECLAGCSSTGQVIVYKLSNKMKLFEMKIPKNHVQAFHLINYSLTGGLQALIVYTTKNKRVAFALINSKTIESQKVLLKIPKRHWAMDISGNKKILAIVSGYCVNFINLQTHAVSSYKMAKDNRTFTCVSCHPCEEMILTGDDTGRIVLWQNLFSKKTQAVYHWHTLPVQCMAFSTFGSYFYSGANEAVLVKWQIDNPKVKQFLPRLPAGIVQLAVSDNNAFVAVATSDNAVRIVDSRMIQAGVIQHMVLGNQLECGICYDHVSKSLVMNGNVGCVQFYSPDDMSLLYNVDIVNQNKLSEERDCKLENTDVKKIALSQNGEWLSTVEERLENDLCKELRLKFWFLNTKKQSYELNTSIEFPHESPITSMAFQPSSQDFKCITVSDDKTFKIWQKFLIESVNNKGPVWKCSSRGTFRDIPCRGLSFSTDGSLFAIAFNAILSIWASENCELKSTLVHSEFKEKIKCIQFGQGNQCHFVVTASKSQLSVWNILTLTMSWIVNIENMSFLVADPLSTHMLIICNGKKHGKYLNKLYVFEPSASTLLFSSDNLLGNGDKIVAASFVPSSCSYDTRLKWFERANLYFITAKSELYRFSKSEEPYKHYVAEDLSEEMSVFSKIKPQIQSSNVKKTVHKHMFTQMGGYKSYREYLEAPLETLPPVSFLASSLLESLVLQRENTNSL